MTAWRALVTRSCWSRSMPSAAWTRGADPDPPEVTLLACTLMILSQAASVGIAKCNATVSHLGLYAILSHLGRADWGRPALSAPGIAAVRSMPARLRGRLSRQEWRSIAGMAGCILLLHIVGWGVLVGIVAPQHYQVSSTQVLGVGLGLTAYTLGMRHAFDADHIAAIDNTTRKLMAEGKRPVSVGFWFSLGHSTIVFGLVALLAFGVRALAGQLENDSSLLHQITGVVGTAVSGTFLYMIGIINLVVLVGLVKVSRRMRHGAYDERALEDQLNNRGFMNKILSGATRPVTRPWQMYPIGALFGLGFDTATESGYWCLPAVRRRSHCRGTRS